MIITTTTINLADVFAGGYHLQMLLEEELWSFTMHEEMILGD